MTAYPLATLRGQDRQPHNVAKLAATVRGMDIDSAPGPNSTVAQRLKWARTYRGFTSDRDAATRCNLVLSTYRKHESGERGAHGLKDHHIRRYARAFNVSKVWLQTGTGHPTAPSVGELDEEEARVIEALRAARAARQA